ncbi:capsular polysaccharide export protein, LipB/KpsS family [Halobacillus litoralis]|nr:hypothetical protein [Halobacillus litoralis]
MNTIKKVVRKLTSARSYNRMASMYNKVAPKQKTDKPIAFLIGFSKWKRPHVETFLQEYEVRFVEDNVNYGKLFKEVKLYKDPVFIVWGYKESQKINAFSATYNIPLYRLEDGFIRSVDLGASHSKPLSMCLDSQALYFDSTQRTDLEDILNSYDFDANSELLIQASESIKQLKDLQISKYNNVEAKDAEAIYGPKKKRRILVIGQVEDDASIKRGCAIKLTNNDLVWIAKTENPDAEIIYKPHPDVLFGKRPMQSNPKDVDHIAHVIKEPLSLSDSFKTIDHVYTITSLAGFEALLRDIPVTTLGAPFYSGWGLTDDRQPVERRQRNLTVEQVFAAAYILYPKYVNPFTKRETTITETISTLQMLRQINNQKEEAEVIEEHALKDAFLIGFSNWQRNFIESYFSNYNVNFISSKNSLKSTMNKLNKSQNKVIFVWRYSESVEIFNYAQENNISIHRVDDGFLRSTGLEETKSYPISLIVDDNGLHYDSEKGSKLVDILSTYEFSKNPELIQEAKSAISLINSLNVSKYSFGVSRPFSDVYGEKQKKRILVLGQVENSILRKSTTMDMSNNDLVWMAKVENPDAEIFYKPHPEVLFGQRTVKSNPEEIAHIAEIVEEPFSISDILDEMDHVYTISSLGGFEALIKGIPVTTFGTPFYAGWGLTDDRDDAKKDKTLSLAELFAGAYMLYPTYRNPFTKKEIGLIEAVKLLSAMKESAKDQPIILTPEEREQLNLEEVDLEGKEPEFTSFIPRESTFNNLAVKGEDKGKIGVLSKGIRDIPNLQSFLDGEVTFSPKESVNELSYLAGWGMKPSAKKALAFCEEHNVPYLRLEDGFLRSVGLGVDNYPPLSMCIDDVGIYYDGTKPSRLENILNTTGWESEELMEYARKAKEMILSNRLSKYNHAPPIDPHTFKQNGKKRVLVIDQTFGDMSVTLGLADEDKFIEMYYTARRENPEADIYIKTHPDVIAGKKKGYFSNIDIDANTFFIYDNGNPITLLNEIDEAYVVTSQMGFEALMLGKKVTCFGLPFYSGWGVTTDKIDCPRRRVVRNVEELFAAAYLLYPRYINPDTGNRGSIFDVIEHIIESKKSELTTMV